MKTRVIQLYAGPGAGKSTLAAQIFAELKQRGKSVELIHEFVKAWAWDNIRILPHHTSILYGNQFQLEAQLYGKVEYLVTDSPVDLRVVFERHYGNHERAEIFRQLWESDRALVADVAEFFPVIVSREKPYDNRGRYESETGARELDDVIRNYLDGRPRVAYDSDFGVQNLCDYVTNDTLWQLSQRSFPGRQS